MFKNEGFFEKQFINLKYCLSKIKDTVIEN